MRGLADRSTELEDRNNRRRTLYATIHRRDMSTTLMIHDFPDPNQHSGSRSSTITPLQGLYALNGPLLTGQAEALASLLGQALDADDRARINQAYWRLFSRAATEREMQLGREYLGDAVGEMRVARWKQYAHVLLASNELLFID